MQRAPSPPEGAGPISRQLQDKLNWMLSTVSRSQSGSHEIETVESGQGIVREFNYMRNGGSDQAAPWADWQEGTASKFYPFVNGKMQRVILWMQAVEHIFTRDIEGTRRLQQARRIKKVCIHSTVYFLFLSKAANYCRPHMRQLIA